MTNQIYIVAEQTIGKTDGSDTTIAELEQLSDDIIDVICLASWLRPVFGFLAIISGYFEPRWQMNGAFRSVRFDEDGNEDGIDEPSRVIDELELEK